MNVGRYLPPSRAPWSVFGVAVALFSALHCLTACRLFEKSLETSLTQDPGINVAIGNNFGDGPHIHAFDAYPREVLIGQPVTVTWFAPLADSVEIVALYGTFPPQTNLPPTGSILI